MILIAYFMLTEVLPERDQEEHEAAEELTGEATERAGHQLLSDAAGDRRGSTLRGRLHRYTRAQRVR